MRLVVRRPGLLTTVQDLGRPGLGRLGVSPSGAMDPLALCAANRMLGNPPGAPAIEVTGAGLELEVLEGGSFGLAGADLGAQVAAHPMAPWHVHCVAAGDVLWLRERHVGARAYIALPGGIDAPRVLGSAAADLESGLGSGRLQRDAVVACAGTDAVARRAIHLQHWYQPPGRLRLILSGSAGLPAQVYQTLLASEYRVSPRSGRMGYRLEGPALVATAPADAASEAIAPGAIQVAPDGQPILLMADRQTVGGYPVVAYLARADVPRAAQLWPGDQVRFEAITRTQAVALARAQQAELSAIGAP